MRTTNLRDKIMNAGTPAILAGTLLLTSLSLQPLAAKAVNQAVGEAERKGQEVADEWDRRDQGFGDTVSSMKMELVNRHGDKSSWAMKQKVLEVPGHDAGDKSLTIFQSPRDIKGTAFLSFAKILDPDDQWLYLPALKRVKRISSTNKSGPFVGSEFAYEDLSAQELKKYTYKWLRDEPCGDLQCFVVEQAPTYKNSGYTRAVVWYDKSEYRQRKIDSWLIVCSNPSSWSLPAICSGDHPIARRSRTW